VRPDDLKDFIEKSLVPGSYSMSGNKFEHASNAQIKEWYNLANN
jgi:hypothetical protein